MSRKHIKESYEPVQVKVDKLSETIDSYDDEFHDYELREFIGYVLEHGLRRSKESYLDVEFDSSMSGDLWFKWKRDTFIQSVIKVPLFYPVVAGLTPDD